jgi:uroporphyrinogen decarboxylase
MPLATYPGLALTGGTVRDMVTSAAFQFEVQAALHERFRTRVVLCAMDLSAEAEAFGAEVLLADDEVPTVLGRRVTSLAEVEGLPVPQSGDARTGVYLETVGRLTRLVDRPVVMAGCVGPFSLAGRLVGVGEAFGLTVTEPTLLHRLLEKCTGFLVAYARALKAAGADGLIMAEPSAGLLSPRAVRTFSSPYIQEVVRGVSDSPFAFLLHNCAAKLVHLPAILAAGPRLFHFGAPMDLPAALAQVSPDIVLCGNLDPAGVFCQSTQEQVDARTRELLAATQSFPNFILSSGCDVPPSAPFANLEAFFEAAQN